MKIVILARETDNHAAPIKWGLEHAGYEVVCWGGLGWPEEHRASISMNREAGLTLGSHRVNAEDVIWMRRLQPATLHPGLCDADRKFAEEESRWFHYSLMYLLERLPVTCINRYSASRLINNKSVQLLLARSCGLRVPRTLMSNSPDAVKSYLQRNSARTICKAFFPHVWQKKDSDAMAVTEAFEVSLDKLPQGEALAYAPAIYQEMVVKQFDVRLVVMGTSVYSFAVLNPKDALDWRQDACQGRVKVESIDTPADIESGVLDFVRQSGIVFGSFDFAVDFDGRWWFLEVNEQGQFLWLEEMHPDARLFQRFLAFLTAPGSSRHDMEQRAQIFPALGQYLGSMPKRSVRNLRKPGGQFVSTES